MSANERLGMHTAHLLTVFWGRGREWVHTSGGCTPCTPCDLPSVVPMCSQSRLPMWSPQCSVPCGVTYCLPSVVSHVVFLCGVPSVVSHVVSPCVPSVVSPSGVPCGVPSVMSNVVSPVWSLHVFPVSSPHVVFPVWSL